MSSILHMALLSMILAVAHIGLLNCSIWHQSSASGTLALGDLPQAMVASYRRRRLEKDVPVAVLLSPNPLFCKLPIDSINGLIFIK